MGANISWDLSLADVSFIWKLRTHFCSVLAGIFWPRWLTYQFPSLSSLRRRFQAGGFMEGLPSWPKSALAIIMTRQPSSSLKTGLRILFQFKHTVSASTQIFVSRAANEGSWQIKPYGINLLMYADTYCKYGKVQWKVCPHIWILRLTTDHSD